MRRLRALPARLTAIADRAAARWRWVAAFAALFNLAVLPFQVLAGNLPGTLLCATGIGTFAALLLVFHRVEEVQHAAMAAARQASIDRALAEANGQHILMPEIDLDEHYQFRGIHFPAVVLGTGESVEFAIPRIPRLGAEFVVRVEREIGQFLDWMSQQGVHRMRRGMVTDEVSCMACSPLSRPRCVVCAGLGYVEVEFEAWIPDGRTIEQLLADYFGIDLDALERERWEILEQLQARTERGV